MEKRRINIIEAAMKHRQITFAITIMLVMLGIWSLFNMPRSEDPHFIVRNGLVVAYYPGADEQQVEKQVTHQLEQYLFGFEEVRKEKTTSETKEGQVVVTVRLQDWVTDPKKFWSTLQHGINTNLRSTLPPGVVGPIVNSDFGDVVAQMITISAPSRSYAEIEKFLDQFEDGIKTIPSVSKIRRYGGQKQQVYVTVNDYKLRQYGFDFSAIARVLQMQNVINNTGDVTFSASNIPIFANSQYKTEADIGNQIVYSDPSGKVVRLKDVATIERKYEEPTSYIEVDNNKVMMLTVEMQLGNNIVKFGDALQKKIDEIKKELPPDVSINTIVNQPKVVAESVNNFMIEFGTAIAAVIIVVMLLLPFRVAIISAVAAPVSIAITFGILNLIGIEIHQVTLAGMIIVLGIVVDDAIVVVDNYVEKLDEGLPRWTAAWQSATQLLVPVFTATATIILSFLPLAFFMTGTTKDFIQALPYTVAIALFTSFLVALFLTPYLSYLSIRKGLKHTTSDKQDKKKMLDYVQDAFDKGLEFCFRYPRATMLIGLVSVFLAGFVGTHVKQVFFPTAERNQFNIEVWLPSGTALAKTEDAVNKVEAVLKSDKRVVNMASFIGTSSPRFQATYSPETPKENYAQIFINTTSPKATDEIVKKYFKKFDNFLPDGYVHLRQLNYQESPAPVEVRITGDNIAELKHTADKVQGIMEKTPGTNWVRNDFDADYFGIGVQMKDDVANRLGVSNTTVTQTLGAEIKGYPVSTLWEGDVPVDILLRLDVKNRSDFNDLQNIYISTSYNTKVPLKDVATLQPTWHTGTIVHRNGLRTLTVRCEAQKGINASEIVAAIQPKIAKLQLPQGFTISYGGELENQTENMPGMGSALGISFMLIFLTLLFQFKSIGKVLIVYAAFPLSLLGAMLGLFITGNPMGFTAFLGILSLMGIVVRNGIILVDFADELVKDHGLSIRDAALAAGKRRMRPVFLTASAAAIGVVPMIVSKSPLWAPMGSILAFGLLISMVMTLFIVPVLYYRFVKPKPETVASTQTDTKEPIQHEPSLS